MGKILCMETATSFCSVALTDGGFLKAVKESSVKNLHASNLTVFVEDVLKSAGDSFAGLDAIAVSMGPGSYTGLRIGVATAKGLCYSTDKPLIAVPTLQSMALGMRLVEPPPASPPEYLPEGKSVNEVADWNYCPMIDARRMEVFCAIYDKNLQEIRETKAEIIQENSFSQFLPGHIVVFAGEGVEKCKPFLKNYKNAIFIDGFNNSAKYMASLAELKFQQGEFENLAYFEPYYLKDFIAGNSSVKGLTS